MGPTIGIDLGTSTSEIAVFRNGKPEFLKDIRNGRAGILPSVVAVGPMGDLVVGETAKRVRGHSCREVKRLMGSDSTIKLGDRTYRPQEISACILRHLKENAERILGVAITEAVITVPAAFKDPERQATMDAGRLAGLNVERIINEPTAAALAYGLNALDAEQHVLVFDLGGGTFDATVLEMFEGLLEVKATAGERELGGGDFDRRIVDILLNDLRRQCDLDIATQPDGVRRKALDELGLIAEQAKIELTAQDAAIIDVPYLAGQAIDFHSVLNRREFDVATRDLVEMMLSSVDRVLSDAKIAKTDLDEVIMVGGATRMQAVRDAVSAYFGGRQLPEMVPPDEAVAMGAAIEAALKTGVIAHAEGLMRTDVTGHSLGVAVLEIEAGMAIPDRMSVIIPRQTTIPVSKAETYLTMHDGQTSVDVRVYQGEAKDVAKNQLLDSFCLGGIPPAPMGEESIAIKFTLDTNGRLDVAAEVKSTGESAAITIEHNFCRMGEAEIENAKRELDDQWKRSAFYQRVQPLIESAERRLGDLEGDDRTKLEGIVESLKSALAENDEAAVDKLDEELTDILFNLQ